MKIQSSTYIGSFPSNSKSPKDNKPEFAFIGRSNVGKSSLINMLTERKDLARVSKSPGKTQYLNFYLINKEWYLVDLPGYGYAKISKKKRHQWEQMIEGYFLHRDTLSCAFVLIDACVPPQEIDIEFINWMGQMKIPFVIVFTKTDRLKPLQKEKNIQAFKTEMLEHWNELPQLFISSAVNKEGREEILNFIKELNTEFA